MEAIEAAVKTTKISPMTEAAEVVATAEASTTVAESTAAMKAAAVVKPSTAVESASTAVESTSSTMESAAAVGASPTLRKNDLGCEQECDGESDGSKRNCAVHKDSHQVR